MKMKFVLKWITAVMMSFAISTASAADNKAAANKTTASPPVVAQGNTSPTIPSPIADSSVSVWANELIIAVYTYNAATVDETLKKLSFYFTPEGWPVFIKALSDSKILETVKQNNYSVSAVAQNPPQIISKGQDNGVYSWTVKMPTLVSYHNKQSQNKMVLEISLTLVASGNKGVRGLAVSQFIAKQIEKPTLCQCGQDFK